MYAQASRALEAGWAPSTLSDAQADLEAAFAECLVALSQLVGDQRARGVATAAHLIAPVDRRNVAGCTQPLVPLTRREREIADLISQGFSNRQVAERLVVSERTVDTHVQNLLRKLQLRSRTSVGLALRALPAYRPLRRDTPSRTSSRR
jgi:DNA-binding NarL/FixJ family response regulator